MPLKEIVDNGLHQECVWGPARGILQEVTDQVGHFLHCLDGHFCDAGCYAIVTACAMLCYAGLLTIKAIMLNLLWPA